MKTPLPPGRNMRPTMTHLPPTAYEAARKRAFDERISLSELLRRALDLYLGRAVAGDEVE